MAKPFAWPCPFPGAYAAHRRRRAAEVLRQLRLGRTRHPCRLVPNGDGTLELRPLERSPPAVGQSGRAGAQPLGLSLPSPGGAMVGGPGLHLKHYALLPVGSTSEGVVPSTRDRTATARDHGPAVPTGSRLVCHTALG